MGWGFGGRGSSPATPILLGGPRSSSLRFLPRSLSLPRTFPGQLGLKFSGEAAPSPWDKGRPGSAQDPSRTSPPAAPVGYRARHSAGRRWRRWRLRARGGRRAATGLGSEFSSSRGEGRGRRLPCTLPPAPGRGRRGPARPGPERGQSPAPLGSPPGEGAAPQAPGDEVAAPSREWGRGSLSLAVGPSGSLQPPRALAESCTQTFRSSSISVGGEAASLPAPQSPESGARAPLSLRWAGAPANRRLRPRLSLALPPSRLGVSSLQGSRSPAPEGQTKLGLSDGERVVQIHNPCPISRSGKERAHKDAPIPERPESEKRHGRFARSGHQSSEQTFGCSGSLPRSLK